MDVNLKYFAGEIKGNELVLKVLPLQKNMPVYFPKETGLSFGDFDFIIEPPKIEMMENRTCVLIAN